MFAFVVNINDILVFEYDVGRSNVYLIDFESARCSFVCKDGEEVANTFEGSPNGAEYQIQPFDEGFTLYFTT
jgi:predicted Ser/Thr protein kinase